MSMSRFEQHPISTQTLIISTNLSIQCQTFFDALQCQPLMPPPTGRARMLVCEQDGLHDGAIVFAQYKTEHKGTAFKKISEKYFLNSVTIIMKIGQKFINIKVSNKGKLQVTGCNERTTPLSILQHFWSALQVYPQTWTFQATTDPVLAGAPPVFSATVVPVMCNINFSIDFQINREMLNNVINTQTRHVSILEPSDGYVGVNIKIAVKDEALEDMLVDHYRMQGGVWTHSYTKFMTYLHTLSVKEQKKKMSKCYVNTFLVFYSGKVIMSGGISQRNRKRAYETFMEIIQQHRDRIKTSDS